jgi:DnaJ-class molecular chaperone
VHPDRNRNDPDSTAKFQSVQYAYSVLSEPRLRSIYDSYGEQVQQHATRRRVYHVLAPAASRTGVH